MAKLTASSAGPFIKGILYQFGPAVCGHGQMYGSFEVFEEKITSHG